jgi:hypothetical protein
VTSRPYRVQTARRDRAERVRLLHTAPRDRVYAVALTALAARLQFAADRHDVPAWVVCRLHVELILRWWADEQPRTTPPTTS